MNQIHVIAHTHWDQEWYFTRQDSMVLASYNFADVIDTLEQDPAYTCYHLDGQMAVVEDFLAINPDYRARLETLVRKKRIFVGPWYTQTDTYNVHGESIIRNLKYGIFAARKLGHAMQVGYLPDTFGHNAQMPTILQGCNIDNIVFWRGIDHDRHVKSSQFLWRAPSGATVIACAMALGYGAAKNMRSEACHLQGKIYPMVTLLRSRAGINDLLLPCGDDQVSIDPALPKILEIASAHSPDKDRYVISSLERYVDILRAQREQFERWEGELKSPRYTRIHKTIGSVRYDIKQKNDEVEQFILRQLEPTIAMARHQGIPVNLSVVDTLWKKLLRSHAHDSIGGCNSDATNRDILHRLEQTEQLCHSLWNLVVKTLAAACAQEGDLLIFNPLATPTQRVVKTTLYSRAENIALTYQGKPIPFDVLKRDELPGGTAISLTAEGECETPLPPYFRWQVALQTPILPSVGYLTVNVEDSPAPFRQPEQIKGEGIENTYYQLTLDTGTLTLHDKRCGRRIPSFFTLEDCADAGDSYDFSPLAGDTPTRCSHFTLVDCLKTPLVEKLIVEATMLLPRDLTDRQEDTRTPFSLRLVCELRHGDPNLYVEASLENSHRDHRLRLLIGSDIHTRHALASQPFAIIQRETGYDDENWQERYREMPVDIETSEGIIAVTEPGKALVVTSRGMKEFQIIGSEPAAIALTMFKSTGVLGRNDLDWRPGRASGINNTVVETPDAQLLKPLRFSFTVALADNADHLTLRQLENQAAGQPFTYQRQTLHTLDHRLERFALRLPECRLPAEFSLLTLPEPLILSALPHAQQLHGTVVRLFNAGTEPVPVPESLAVLRQINYLEEPMLPVTAILPSATCDFLIEA
ncbi:glycoside hydrolase family 38 C-terminal domain-containing protein [Enterobacter hormaechei]|uniref:glycoside hydrolase family 38 N-terminal domain-containing protein n=1 Tax=Enterobacter hormaechei TaxID=158836 RepID=UPI000642FEAA|nr:glycoside hydrolase family 38 C-terminal domain-containing protein [Enterobacter hormaechei]KLR13618.1 alpha-mannosidase [Enterobacter hormaechei subsp. hormaechei]MDV5368952.1 glycoside hydrolase family 38 C-terminal domain-containing protein [Enterobacter hormaechei]MDV5635261.1 glycoside hydrolase family 38 C-terminal domain-containing protein [Enterobacter hormaechei]RTP15077.1 alpha-mannosidase [Enterobacter hormaechei]HBL4914497.1 alpha-mannosidase [Enterobacter hormaechei]